MLTNVTSLIFCNEIGQYLRGMHNSAKRYFTYNSCVKEILESDRNIRISSEVWQEEIYEQAIWRKSSRY